MIQFKNIAKQFGKQKVLKNINIALEPGEIIALIGPNACGKTTLIKCLLGMVIPDSGSIHVLGKEIKNQWNYRNNIGYMPQIGRYPENMTVGQIIDMIERLRKDKIQTLDKELYESFQLHNILKKRINTLSGGTKQKISAYLAFLFSPKILILDEPTAGLDPLSAQILKEKVIRERNNGKTILMTSHIISELEDTVDQLIYMKEGQIIFYKTLEKVKADTQKEKLTEAIVQIMKNNQKQ